MCEKRRNISLIGIGMGNPELLTVQALSRIRESGCLIGARRMLECVQESIRRGTLNEAQGKPCFAEYEAEKILALLEAHPQYESVAVLLSGDTGFYSGAKKLKELLERFPDRYETELIPGISTPAYLAARLGITWEDAKIISLHGTEAAFAGIIARNEKTFLLLGGKDCGRRFLKRLLEYGLGDVTLCAGSRLSYADERIRTDKAEKFAPEDLEGLCAVYALNDHPRRERTPHIRDSEFIRGSVPMTKEEVRALSIARLELREDSVVYDVGAGTGSVSVEAALSGESCRVWAIEKNPDAVKLIEENRRKFCADGIRIVSGNAPKAMEDLETPTHVFIGGSSGNLKDILREALRKNPRVCIVINAASLETLGEVMEAEREGLLKNMEITQICASRSRELGNYHMMTGMNPVYIISAGGEIE